MPICPDCRAVVSATARFCDNCGYPLSAPPPGLRPASTPQAAAQPAAPSHPISGQQLVSQQSPEKQPAVGAFVCSACGSENLPGEMFCQNCGVQLPPLSSRLPPPPAPVQQVALPVAAPAAGLPGTSILTPLPGAQAAPVPPVAPAPADTGSLGRPPVETPTGAPAPTTASPGRLVLRPSGQVIHLPVGQPEILIGRSDPVKGVYPQVDLSSFGADVSGVSRKHARLLFNSGQIAIEDLHSTNFTFVNRQKLDPGVPYPLYPGDELRMGLLVMEYQADG